MRPLDGIRVLDLTRLLPGASATQTLANFGAEVIKVEEPGRGDYSRFMPPLIDGVGAMFTLLNRGKKSVALNMKEPRARDALLKLAESADVLIESFRPGVLERFGVGWNTLRKVNPRLIYVPLTGYGHSGGRVLEAGHDVNYMSLGGALGELGGVPGIQIADLAGGAMQAVIGVLLALAAREKTGRGQLVDVAMLDGVVSLLPIPLAWLNAGAGENILSGRYACYSVYKAADGRRLAVGALEPKFWKNVCIVLGFPEFAADQFAGEPRRTEIRNAVSSAFLAHSAGEWLASFAGVDACVTLVRSVAETFADEELRVRGTVMRIDGMDHIGVTPKLEETPGVLGGAPPELGQHTREVLRAANLTEDELEALC